MFIDKAHIHLKAGGDSVKFFDASSKKSFVSERYSYISYSEDIADQLSGLIGRDNVVLK